MTEQPLISIITPVRDARLYLQEAHNSVMAQTWTNWEWLICDNGSKDGSLELLRSFTDPRIQLFTSAKPGVSGARNRCLEHAKGEFVCLLDGDDVLPERSLESRAQLLIEQPEVAFCDGQVEYWNDSMDKKIRTWKPRFKGEPMGELLRIQDSCFFGNTWMIRRDPKVRFDLDLRYSEDLMYYLCQCRGKQYSFVEEPILKYRTGHFHAMSDGRGVEAGYRHVAAKLPALGFTADEVGLFRKAAQRICFRSALKEWRMLHAVKLQVAGL